MGTDIGIADAQDKVSQFLGQLDATTNNSGYLYPLALCVPGIQHILDSALLQGLGALDWWVEWQSAAKITCQWLGVKMHRVLLQGFLDFARGQRPAGQSVAVFGPRGQYLCRVAMEDIGHRHQGSGACPRRCCAGDCVVAVGQ